MKLEIITVESVECDRYDFDSNYLIVGTNGSRFVGYYALAHVQPGDRFVVVYNKSNIPTQFQLIPDAAPVAVKDDDDEYVTPEENLALALEEYMDVYCDTIPDVSEPLFNMTGNYLDKELVNLVLQDSYINLILEKLSENYIITPIKDEDDDDDYDCEYDDSDDEDEYNEAERETDDLLLRISEQVTNLLNSRAEYLKRF